MKGMRKFFGDGGGATRLSLRYYSVDVDAVWTIDDDGADSLQIVYECKGGNTVYDPQIKGTKVVEDEKFWLYLSPADAAALGAVLTGYAAAHGESA